MLLYFIRHGDPIYHPDMLTPLGHRQAEAVAKRLSLYGVDAIYASSAIRAQETAAPTAEITKKPVTVLDWCNEHYCWLDMTVPVEGEKEPIWGFSVPEVIELFQSPEIEKLGQEWYRHPFFEGRRFESGYKRIQKETRNFLDSLGFAFEEEKGMYRVKEPGNDKRVALFAHQGFGFAFLSTVLHIPYPRFCTSFDCSHSGVTVIEFRSDREYTNARVLTLANDSHLYREGLPTKYNNHLYF